MDSSDIIRLLNTSHYSPANLEEVNDLCRNYPMFNLAHMLKVRSKEARGHDKGVDLKVAAVYSSDRKKLYALVTEVNQPQVPEPEEEIIPVEPGAIQFSDEPHSEADVIIEQHAPYVVPESSEDLLELDEEEEQEAFTLVETPTIDEVERKPKGSTKKKLIDSFIRDEPGAIRADKHTNLKGDVSLSSIREHDGFITDTLAKIYVKQGLFAKAIYAYEKLSLKYPEKSAYFAAQIEKIKNINYS